MNLIKVLEGQNGKPTCIGDLRGFGFSTALREMCRYINSLEQYEKYRNCKILTNNTELIKNFTNLYELCNIDAIRGKSTYYLIETDIDYKKLDDEVKEMVVGGFSSYPIKEYYESVDLNTNLFGNDKKSFNEEIVYNFKKEANDIMKKLPQIREDNLKKDNSFGNYKNLVNTLKEITNLISIYDWKFKYSEYTTVIDGEEVKQLCIWEQNSDGNIRNKKIWNIK